MTTYSEEASRALNYLASMPRYGHATVSKKDLKSILENTGGQMFALGILWEIKVKHLGVGVYRISLEEWKNTEQVSLKEMDNSLKRKK